MRRAKMADLGRVLIADDEELFLKSTGDLLRREGFECDCVPDGPSAAARIKEAEYDVLLADIMMPGNPKLELVRSIQQAGNDVAVILVTGYPSLNTAVDSIGLSVAAYLVKPVDFEELLREVKSAVERTRIQRTVRRSRESLQVMSDRLDEVLEVMENRPGGAAVLPVDTFVGVTLQNIVTSLDDLRSVTEALAGVSGKSEVCKLLRCPRSEALMEALRSTVEVLRKSKNAFKSKELGELRKHLEEVLEDGGGRPGKVSSELS
jgi:CheY-like chemotaxis protein